LRSAAALVSQSLKDAAADVKLVPSELMHFTLHFLGDVAPEFAERAAQAVESVSGAYSFPVEFSGAGAFPGSRNPQTLWLGLSRGGEEMSVLRKTIGSELSAGGFALDPRPFAPHLTLGRAKNPAGSARLRKILEENRTVKIPAGYAESVALFESRQTPAGPEYTVVRRAALMCKSAEAGAV
jgi:2'-5' RNA ligase